MSKMSSFFITSLTSGFKMIFLDLTIPKAVKLYLSLEVPILRSYKDFPCIFSGTEILLIP